MPSRRQSYNQNMTFWFAYGLTSGCDVIQYDDWEHASIGHQSDMIDKPFTESQMMWQKCDVRFLSHDMQTHNHIWMI